MQKTIIALSLALLMNGAAAQEGYSAKSLFFAEDGGVSTANTGTPALAEPVKAAAKKAAPKKTVVATAKKSKADAQIGTSYFIRIKNGDGSTRDVLASRKFNTGEKFQLGVKVNRPSYVYVLNQAPDGKVTQIYPQPGKDNFIDAMGTVFLPGRGAFEFEGPPGTEQLLVYMSPKPLDVPATAKINSLQPDLVASNSGFSNPSGPACPPPAQAVASAGTPVVTGATEWQTVDPAQPQLADAGYSAKSVVFTPDSECTAAPAAGQGYASKAIVFSEDVQPDTGGHVAAYIVKTLTSKDDGLYLKLQLSHQ
ncbi:DUF4384 domain-containing protein [Janthinobacterium sp. GB4P2]|uniref:DUF4384 domain-containing protein n=1 Tax=Janthinobacterium sp. GB4P2 TaxID=3424189 RepID=UPI003F1F6269